MKQCLIVKQTIGRVMVVKLKKKIFLWFCFIFTPVEKYQKNQNDICHEHINI